MSSRNDVNNFLGELKRIASKRGVNLIDRDKNELAKQSLTMLDFQNIILQLNYKNYCKGPEPDKGGRGDVWMFGKIIGGDEYYIKLKITFKTYAVCISFHPAEHPIAYPLK